MKHVVWIGVMSVLMLVGCSKYADTPTPTRWQTSRQHKLTAAEHWRRIADHFAAQVVADLQGKGAGLPLYVPIDESGEFPFVEGFRELLTTALVRKGQDVRTRPGNNVQTVEIRYAVYSFDPERAKNTYYYGEATALALGLTAIGGIMAGNTHLHFANLSRGALSENTGRNIAGKLVGSLAVLEGMAWLSNEALNGKNARGPVPSSEIMVTASVTQGDRIVTRYSSLYYVADEDAALYWTKSATQKGTLLRVRGEEE